MAALLLVLVTVAALDNRHIQIDEIVKLNGYEYETYKVTTEDGYILQLDRLHHKAMTSEAKSVLLVHGIQDGSSAWVINDPEKAMGFKLADAGFDVWLANNRGNDFSRSHEYLDVDSEQFWEFDFEDMGLYDIPAFVNKIHEVRGPVKHQSDAFVGKN